MLDFLSECISTLLSLRQRLIGSEYGELAEAVITIMIGAWLAVQVGRGTWRVTQGGWRAAKWAWTEKVDPLCQEILTAIDEPGALWEPATREYLCRDGMLLKPIIIPDRSVTGLHAIIAQGKDVTCELTAREIGWVCNKLRQAIDRLETEAREVRRSEALARVRGEAEVPLVAAMAKKGK